MEGWRLLGYDLTAGLPRERAATDIESQLRAGLPAAPACPRRDARRRAEVFGDAAAFDLDLILDGQSDTPHITAEQVEPAE